MLFVARWLSMEMFEEDFKVEVCVNFVRYHYKMMSPKIYVQSPQFQNSLLYCMALDPVLS